MEAANSQIVDIKKPESPAQKPKVGSRSPNLRGLNLRKSFGSVKSDKGNNTFENSRQIGKLENKVGIKPGSPKK